MFKILKPKLSELTGIQVFSQMKEWGEENGLPHNDISCRFLRNPDKDYCTLIFKVGNRKRWEKVEEEKYIGDRFSIVVWNKLDSIDKLKNVFINRFNNYIQMYKDLYQADMQGD